MLSPFFPPCYNRYFILVTNSNMTIALFPLEIYFIDSNVYYECVSHFRDVPSLLVYQVFLLNHIYIKKWLKTGITQSPSLILKSQVERNIVIFYYNSFFLCDITKLRTIILNSFWELESHFINLVLRYAIFFNILFCLFSLTIFEKYFLHL